MVVFGEAEEASRAQLERCLDVAGEGSVGVLCADHHKGYSMPIGGVVASDKVVMPAGVGYDIGCGNAAVRTTIKVADGLDVRRVMDEIWKVISFGMGQKNGERVETHHVYDEILQSPVLQQRAMLQRSRDQLGTVGSGNHYVDLFADEDGFLWVGVHFGSRGFGHKTASGFLALANGKNWDERVNDSMDAPPATIRLGTPMADDYLQAMSIAGDYAYAGREWVIERVLRILGSPETTFRVHNHHNYAWWETHDGRPLLVTRKGATPAFPGQQGFVGATMLGTSVILEGVDSERSRLALYSTVHGAGRVMSRTAAAGRSKVIRKWRCMDYRKCDFAGAQGGFRRGPNGETPKCPQCGHKLHLEEMKQSISKGAIDWDAVLGDVARMGVELRGSGADEAPGAYKNLDEVLTYHADTVRVLHRLRPLGVAMAGHDTYDPYKD